jgi:hypothetical protein
LDDENSHSLDVFSAAINVDKVSYSQACFAKKSLVDIQAVVLIIKSSARSIKVASVRDWESKHRRWFYLAVSLRPGYYRR